MATKEAPVDAGPSSACSSADTKARQGDAREEDECVPCREAEECSIPPARPSTGTTHEAVASSPVRERQRQGSGRPDSTVAKTQEQTAVPLRPEAPNASGPAPAEAPPLPSLPSEAPALSSPAILIEYCDRCRWAPRATWMMTELLLSFPCPRPPPQTEADEPLMHKPLPAAGLRSVTILPRTAHSEGGIFRIWLVTREGDPYDPQHIPQELQHARLRIQSDLLWDRKTEGRFPEPKEIKQKVRDIIAPGLNLGHSDKK